MTTLILHPVSFFTLQRFLPPFLETLYHHDRSKMVTKKKQTDFKAMRNRRCHFVAEYHFKLFLLFRQLFVHIQFLHVMHFVKYLEIISTHQFRRSNSKSNKRCRRAM